MNGNIYQTIIDEIFLTRLEINNLTKELDRIIERSGPKPVQAQNYEPKTGGNRVDNVNDLYDIIIENKKKIAVLKQKLEHLKQQKRELEARFLLTLNETERRVFILSRQNRNAMDISITVNRDEQYIWNLTSKIRRKMNEWMQKQQNI